MEIWSCFPSMKTVSSTTVWPLIRSDRMTGGVLLATEGVWPVWIPFCISEAFSFLTDFFFPKIFSVHWLNFH